MPGNQPKFSKETYARKPAERLRPASAYDALLNPERTLPEAVLVLGTKVRDIANPEYDELYFDLIGPKGLEAGSLSVTVRRDSRVGCIEDIEIDMGKETPQYERVAGLKLVKFLAGQGIRLTSVPPLSDEEQALWKWLESGGAARRTADDQYEVF